MLQMQTVSKVAMRENTEAVFARIAADATLTRRIRAVIGTGAQNGVVRAVLRELGVERAIFAHYGATSDSSAQSPALRNARAFLNPMALAIAALVANEALARQVMATVDVRNGSRMFTKICNGVDPFIETPR